MTLNIEGDLRALIRDVEQQLPDRVTAEVNARWADAAAERLREYVGGGPMTRYLTARTGAARQSVTATHTSAGGTISATGPGMNLLEEGTAGLPGGAIRPRRGKWLTFRLRNPWDGAEATGNWVRVRQVRLRPRHMVRDAALQATAQLDAFVNFALETP